MVMKLISSGCYTCRLESAVSVSILFSKSLLSLSLLLPPAKGVVWVLVSSLLTCGERSRALDLFIVCKSSLVTLSAANVLQGKQVNECGEMTQGQEG